MIQLLYLFLAPITGILFAEFSGYWIHRMLHSPKTLRSRFGWLVLAHLNHHLVHYPPNKLRSDEYKRPSGLQVFGVGLEWAFPVGIVLGVTLTGLLLLGVPYLWIYVFLASGTLYAIVSQNWMHDQYHLKDPIFWGKLWFHNLRDLHDLHHWDMTANFGISTLVMDRIFGTFRDKDTDLVTLF